MKIVWKFNYKVKLGIFKGFFKSFDLKVVYLYLDELYSWFKR